MSKYSSDSESEKSSSRYRRKHSKRSSSLDSSDSSSSYQKRSKYSKGRRRHRSRSRSRDKDKSSKSYKHSRGSSRDRRKHQSQKSRSNSAERNRSRKRSASREKSTSRSSSSLNIEKLGNASRDNFLMNDTKIKSSILEDINNDEFVPKQFVSTAKNKESKMKNIVIDMVDNTILVPQIANASEISNSIFHTSIMADKEAKFDKWVKKLYALRQKAVSELNYS
ncbi:hypothetical protein TSAR_005659 [Trichomalopsis sarcophagae]|uniref:Uncharacterized protein n=1 Tax=Trichomalopsis sarcophagae TaxID=543379 RepID=A0A232ERL4_9HYME|nr:hypothetical protein TSAR_005659 [Trichomalopsis sarcophagae]